MTLSNFDIEEICKELKLAIVGVYSKDELERIDKYEGSYYVNMQDSDDGNGTHWVFMYIDKDGKALYFDSFGVPPPVEIEKFLKMFKPFYVNDRQIQDMKSTNCGFYCIALDSFLKYHYDKKNDLIYNYAKFINMWSFDTKTNDKVLKEYMSK